MVDFTDFFMWDAGVALLYTVLGVCLWLICSSEDLRYKIKHPKFVGFGVSLLSCFSLGLYAVVPGFTFLLVSYSMEYWYFKLNRNRNI